MRIIIPLKRAISSLQRPITVSEAIAVKAVADIVLMGMTKKRVASRRSRPLPATT
jgi:hypothetical protein